MRSKHKVTLGLALLGVFSVATACGDDDTIPGGNGEAGESAGGSEGAMGSAGSTNGGKAGSAAAIGGEPSVNGGYPHANGGESGSGPNPSGEGGESGSGAEPSSNGGQGGEGGGGGGSGSGSGGEGGGGPVACTEITLGQFESIVGSSYGRYQTTFTPNIMGAGDDVFRLSVYGPPDYDGDQTGTFDLTENGDENYRTCSRCFIALGDTAGDPIVFFQSEGTLVIDEASQQLYGAIDATVTNLKLVEVTLDEADGTSTPVPGGACLTLASATIQAEAPPCEGFRCQNGECLPQATWQCDATPDCNDASDEAPANTLCIVPDGWLCQEDYIGDLYCDCGCGAKDTDCTSTTDVSECDYCLSCGGSCAVVVDPEDTTTCL